MNASDKILNNVSGKTPSVLLPPHPITIFGGWNLTNRISESNLV